MKKENIFICPLCNGESAYDEQCRGVLYNGNKMVAIMTNDCHGIPFRRVCSSCYDTIMDEKGYDGEYYTALDENIWEED